MPYGAYQLPRNWLIITLKIAWGLSNTNFDLANITLSMLSL